MFNQISSHRCLSFTAIVQRFVSLWRKRFAEEVDQNLMYIVAVDRVLQLEDFQEV